MPEDVLFQEAVEALRQGNKSLAKEKLTFLLKAEQTNPTYWVWMSAAVKTPKEQIYCLQTALKLDPQNATAKRGLVLLGALPPDENIQPFPVNRPRAWEQKLLLAHELPHPTGVRAITSNPAARLAGIAVLGIAVCGLAYMGLTSPRRSAPLNTITPGPSPTGVATVTFSNIAGQPTPTFLGPTPLWMLLPATYTPTPLYVNTPRPPQSADQYRAARNAYDEGDWDTYIEFMREISRVEPESADIFYYIGEAYRFQGLHVDALESYNRALQIDPSFGPPYLGLARARLMQDDNANVESLYAAAIERDPDFGEVYLDRAEYDLNHRDYDSALVDLGLAERRMPGSALVQLTYARLYLALDDSIGALEAARKANELDLTLLPGYFLRGQAAALQGEYLEAIDALETYIIYEPKDGAAFALLGESYFGLDDYEQAVGYLGQAIPLLSFGPLQQQSYLYRGLAYLELGNADRAVSDLEDAYDSLPDSFDLNIGLARAYYLQEKYGSAYLKTEETEAMAETDKQRAQVYYWRALSQEKREAFASAIRDWDALLKLPRSATTPEMRAEAQEHLLSLLASTPTPRATPSRTPTPRPTATRTPTRTPTP